MSQEIPCGSNDYQLTLFSALLDDDDFTLDIVPCANSDPVVVVTEQGGEESVEATVASQTTSAAVDDEQGETVEWGTTEATASVTEVTTTATPEGTTTPTAPLFSTEDKEDTEEGEQNINEETSQTSSFYTCHPDPSSLISGDFSPDDSFAQKYEVAYDYEVITYDSVNVTDELGQLENIMAEDMANQYGLLDCTSKLRRGLRQKRSGDISVVALDSDPVDVVMSRDCTTFTEPNKKCTSVRGYMTIWSESDNTSSILQSISDGMNNGSYQSDNVAKMVYIGVPSKVDFQPEAATTLANKAVDTDNTRNKTVLLPVGITLLVLAMACVTFFVTRRRRHDDRNGPKPEPSQFQQTKLEVSPTIDLEDDINLLSTMEKMDMTPITESARLDSLDEIDQLAAAYETIMPMKKLETEDMQSAASSILSHEDETAKCNGSASGLAAIGTASTLAMRMGDSDYSL